MATKPRVKMTAQERAKQFMPFSPLSGLGMALLNKEKEKVREAKKLLDRDKEEEISRALNEIDGYKEALVTYFCGGEYKKIAGKVKRIDENKKVLLINDTEISFSDIFDIKIR